MQPRTLLLNPKVGMSGVCGVRCLHLDSRPAAQLYTTSGL
jgi:hypothetical protein